MANQGETVQFTSRIDARVYGFIKRRAEKKGTKINQELNDLLQVAIKCMAAQQMKKASAATPAS